MTPDAIFDGLNSEQRLAVEAVRGPVCILAGAGSGKTTTITRRIANQVETGAFGAPSILAVTFTDKAAGEMRARLAALGAGGVRAQTFHAAALAQLHHLGTEPVGRVLSTKAVALRQIANSLPKPYRFRAAADLASEIEWAKNRRLAPDSYMNGLNGHQPPIPPDLMTGVWHTYERRKAQKGFIDFEDLLELAVRMYDTDDYASERLHARYHAFTVDEYQDVNLLQQSLLERWLGGRDDICVVGDDYQSIYSFTGATPDHLLTMPKRFVRTTVVRLESNYRSSPQILETANRLVPQLGGAEKELRPTRPSGDEPAVCRFATLEEERVGILEQVRWLNTSRGVAYNDMALFYRANFHSEDFEELFADAGVPYQVSGGAFLKRQAARRILPRLKSSRVTDVAVQVRRAAERDGFVEPLPEGLGDQETTRQKDLGRIVRLAEEFDDGERTAAAFAADIETRFGGEGDARGVHLLTYHKAKGLEFEAVLMPKLEEGEIPFKRSSTDAAIAEERRLFYVGITRAKSHLYLSWVGGGKQKASRFLAELGVAVSPERRGGVRRASADARSEGPIFGALKQWRARRAGDDGVPAYVVFHDSTLRDIATYRPRNKTQLARIQGVGPAKIERYGTEVITALERALTDAGSPNSGSAGKL